MKWKIKDIWIDNPIVAAPMAGISNGAFRELCFKMGAGLVYTEMVSDKAIIYRNQKTMKMLEIDDRHHPIALQLFGSDVDSMVQASQYLDQNTNCDIIDINMGCPVNKVVKTGAGSALMKEPDKAVAIVEKILKVIHKPLTVKMRLGYTHDDINYMSLAKRLEEVGVSAITLHARTRSDMYEGKADWRYIRELKKVLNIPVIGNGDIKNIKDAIAHLDEADAIMIGRGLIGKPFLIKEILAYLNNEDYEEPTIKERFAMCLEHFTKLSLLYGEKTAASQMRSIAPHYLSGLKNASRYKARMSQIASITELEMIFKDYMDQSL